MSVESRLGRALERDAAALDPDVPAALREVRRRDRRLTSRRVVGVTSLAVVALVVGTLVGFGLPFAGDSDRAGHSSQTAGRSGSAGLTVVRERTASSLGMRDLLRATVSPDGRVYVTDSTQRVVELTPDLQVVNSWGGSGTAPGRFRFVQGAITTDPEGRVYVADTGNFRIQVFSAEGRFLRSLGRYGTGPGQFTWPFDVVVDRAGDLYVADDKEQTVTKLTPDGRQVWRRGGFREADQRLRGHAHLSSFDAQGRLLVAIDDQPLLARLDPRDGAVAGVVPVQAAPARLCDVTSDRLDRLFLTPCLPPWEVRIVGPDGDPLGGADLDVEQSPRWSADGRGYAVTSDGGIAEVRVSG